MNDINVFLSLGAGFLSFISPCCLPLYPAFLSYITGMSIGKLQSEQILLQKRSLLHTIIFLLGFSTIFIALGFSSSIIGIFFKTYIDIIRRIGAIIIIIFGLLILGVIKPKFMLKDYRFSFKNRPSGYIGTFLIGLSFAAGWTPCTGPILGAVFYLASTNPNSSLLYMGAYIGGFSIPFLLLSFFIGNTTWIQKHSLLFIKIGGSLMVVMGFLLFFDGMNFITRFISPLFGGFRGF